MDRVTHVPLDDRDVEHVLEEGGDGEHAEEAVLAQELSGGVDDANGEVVGLHGPQHAALRAGAGEHEQLGWGVDGLGAERFGDPVLAMQHAETGPLGNESAADGDEVAVAEEREVPVGEPAEQVREVVRAGHRRRARRAVGAEQAVGE